MWRLQVGSVPSRSWSPSTEIQSRVAVGLVGLEEEREHFVAGTPTEHARMIAIAQDEAIDVRGEALPRHWFLEIQPDARTENGALVENAEAHFIGQLGP
jgi:hypothetical protein